MAKFMEVPLHMHTHYTATHPIQMIFSIQLMCNVYVYGVDVLIYLFFIFHFRPENIKMLKVCSDFYRLSIYRLKKLFVLNEFYFHFNLIYLVNTFRCCCCFALLFFGLHQFIITSFDLYLFIFVSV